MFVLVLNIAGILERKMAADRKNYVMSVDFAMKREMAYREKLRAEGRLNSTNMFSRNDPLPPKVLAPTSGHTPRAILQPTPNVSPGLTVAPTNNPTPRPYFGPRPVQTLQPRPYLQHHGPITGSRPLLRPPPFQGPRLKPGAIHYHGHLKRKKPIHQQVEAEKYYCELCDVDCTSEFNLRMHFKGHKHKAKQRDANSKKVSAGVVSQQGVKPHKYCELCAIWCTDENSFRLHLDGKSHFLKLHAAGKKIKS
ncbi:zinc finger RNA-binding protein 2-like [Chenopodium quinoa]|uniref:zinc finger RNA-binding protein 2-like n=1 Tax=Chenopodium quinoa TaxID=63459 RepID=UPI000B78F39F|nr:zinc finger RNA-binding protein 2-like [Chenopodium quinoa]